MNIKVLTDEQIIRILEENRPECDGLDKAIAVSRAIEQAILQSEQVQAWKKDAEAFRLMVSKRLTVSVREFGHEVEVFHLYDCLAWSACDPNADDDTRAEVARSVIATAVAAMEKKT